MKRHKWKLVKTTIEGVSKQYECIYCDLERAEPLVRYSRYRWTIPYQLFYFRSKDGKITYGGKHITKVPYGCTHNKAKNYFLEEELFEI